MLINNIGTLVLYLQKKILQIQNISDKINYIRYTESIVYVFRRESIT